MWSLSSAIPLRFKEGNFLFHIVSGIPAGAAPEQQTWHATPFLDAHSFDRGTPVGEAQLPERARLERVYASRAEVVGRDRRLRAGDRNLYPTHSGFDRLKPGVPEVVSSGLRDRFNPHEELTAIALIDPNSGRC